MHHVVGLVEGVDEGLPVGRDARAVAGDVLAARERVVVQLRRPCRPGTRAADLAAAVPSARTRSRSRYRSRHRQQAELGAVRCRRKVFLARQVLQAPSRSKVQPWKPQTKALALPLSQMATTSCRGGYRCCESRAPRRPCRAPAGSSVLQHFDLEHHVIARIGQFFGRGATSSQARWKIFSRSRSKNSADTYGSTGSGPVAHVRHLGGDLGMEFLVRLGHPRFLR